MKKTLLKIGADGGSISIRFINLNGITLYEFEIFEAFEYVNLRSVIFLGLHETWAFLKLCYPSWYQLYPVTINTQIAELVKKDYILADDKNEYTIDSWLQQLTGRGIGF